MDVRKHLTQHHISETVSMADDSFIRKGDSKKTGFTVKDVASLSMCGVTWQQVSKHAHDAATWPNSQMVTIRLTSRDLHQQDSDCVTKSLALPCA